MTRHVNTSELGEKLASLLSAVEDGEEVIITRDGEPVARLLPMRPHAAREVRDTIQRIRQLRRGMHLGDLDWRALRDTGRR